MGQEYEYTEHVCEHGKRGSCPNRPEVIVRDTKAGRNKAIYFLCRNHVPRALVIKYRKEFNRFFSQVFSQE